MTWAQTTTGAAAPPLPMEAPGWMSWLGAAVGMLGGAWALLAQWRLRHERRLRRQAEAERESAALQARRLSRQLDATLAAVPDLLFEFDLAGRYVAVHVGQDSALLAADPSRIVGRQVDELLPPDAAAVVHESLAAAQLHGRDQGRRIQLTLPGGRQRWFELASGRKQAAGQDDDEHVLMLSRDITALVQAERRLVEQQQELQLCRQAARFQDLFERAPAPLAVLHDGCFTDANPAFRALAGPLPPGLPVTEWCRRGLADPQVLASLERSWLFVAPAEPAAGDGQPGPAPEATAAPAADPHPGLPVLHLPWRDADGRRRLLQLHGRRHGPHCVLSLCDLSLEAQDAELARAELRATALQLQWLAASWGPPLRRLALALGPLGEQGPAAEPRQLLCDLQQMLDAVTQPGGPSGYGAAEAAAHGDADPVPRALAALAAEALRRLARARRARRRELVLRIDPALRDVRVASPATWCALLLALGHALLQASPDVGAMVVALDRLPAPGALPLSGESGEGGRWSDGTDAVSAGPLTTDAGLTTDAAAGTSSGTSSGTHVLAPAVRLSLALQGVRGRRASTTPRPHSTDDAQRATAALAEALARSLCERLGGRWAPRETRPADDTDPAPWVIDLPSGPAADTTADMADTTGGTAADAPDTAEAGARTSPAPAPAAWRALVIDDLPAARQALQQALQAAGLTVVAVDDAAHALARLVTEQAGDQAPALICIDERMPDMDGAALGLAIRALQLPGPPLLALFSRQDAGGPLPEGFDARLDKPLQPRQIERLLERLRQGPHASRDDADGDRAAATAPLRHVATGMPAAVPANVTATAGPPAPAPERRPQVLVVDDNALNREVAADALRHAGIEVTTVEDGLLALEWLEHHTPDLILMDVQMPRLDGVRATEVLRQMPALHGVPVIALTANGSEEDRQRCLAAGMDDHLCKPVLPSSLVLQVGHWLVQGRRPAPVRPEAPAALLDVQRGLALCGGGQALYRAMLGHFIDHQPTARAALDQARTTGDTRRIEHLVHTLKGSAAQIGARRLQQACERLEAAGEATADADAQALRQVWDASVEAARRHLATDGRP